MNLRYSGLFPKLHKSCNMSFAKATPMKIVVVDDEFESRTLLTTILVSEVMMSAQSTRETWRLNL